MALSEQKKQLMGKRILLSRNRILCNHGFYGLLLMHMTYSLDEECQTAYTDGERIAFSPDFLEGLSDKELDFVMMHEILHVVLKHCLRKGDRNHQAFNIACDIVVNSNIMLSNNGDKSSITLREWGESMHLAPNGNEGHLYTAEEVYKMFESKAKKQSGSGSGGGGGQKNKGAGSSSGSKKQNTPSGKNGDDFSDQTWDDHGKWGKFEEDDAVSDMWTKRFQDACKAIEVRQACQGNGNLPAFAERLWKELTKPQTDWRTVLSNFVQEEINDYSFSPPDRRFDDNPFFLPDFNEKDDVIEDVLFMIDTSGSMTDKMINAAYSEVKGAIDQFNGKLRGWLGFFDAQVVEPKPFSNEDEFKIIKAFGGGGTSFHSIFNYVKKNFVNNRPACIIILTDGYATFPKEKEAEDIPVLWLLNNDVVKPPWGKVARITV